MRKVKNDNATKPKGRLVEDVTEEDGVTILWFTDGKNIPLTAAFEGGMLAEWAGDYYELS